MLNIELETCEIAIIIFLDAIASQDSVLSVSKCRGMVNERPEPRKTSSSD